MSDYLLVSGRRVGQLSDAELENERRRLRANRAHEQADRIPGWQVRQWLRNLELPNNAERSDVDAAFRKLRERYRPHVESNDPEKSMAAERLLGGLRNAYEGLLRHFES